MKQLILTNIEMLCDVDQSMQSIEQDLTYLLMKFDIVKSQFSSHARRSLRQRFSHLAEQCQKRNAPKQIVSLAINLADHAYKMPDRM